MSNHSIEKKSHTYTLGTSNANAELKSIDSGDYGTVEFQLSNIDVIDDNFPDSDRYTASLSIDYNSLDEAIEEQAQSIAPKESDYEYWDEYDKASREFDDALSNGRIENITVKVPNVKVKVKGDDVYGYEVDDEKDIKVSGTFDYVFGDKSIAVKYSKAEATIAFDDIWAHLSDSAYQADYGDDYDAGIDKSNGRIDTRAVKSARIDTATVEARIDTKRSRVRKADDEQPADDGDKETDDSDESEAPKESEEPEAVPVEDDGEESDDSDKPADKPKATEEQTATDESVDKAVLRDPYRLFEACAKAQVNGSGLTYAEIMTVAKGNDPRPMLYNFVKRGVIRKSHCDRGDIFIFMPERIRRA